MKTTDETTIDKSGEKKEESKKEDEKDKTSTGENKVVLKDEDKVKDTTVESSVTVDVPKSVDNEEDKSNDSQINKAVNEEETVVVQEEAKSGEGNQANITNHEKTVKVEIMTTETSKLNKSEVTQLLLEETQNQAKPTSDQKNKEDNAELLNAASIDNKPQALPSLDFEAEINALQLNMALVLDDTPLPQQQENLDVTSAVNPTSHAALDLMLKDILEFSNTDSVHEKEGELENR